MTPIICPLLAFLVVVGVGGCASPPPPVQVAPPRDIGREVLLAQNENRLLRPSRLFFAWSAREPDFRGSGSGVARVEPPLRARLDLFLDNGEAAAVAALVRDEMRTPPAVPDERVPPPALLWATFGVLQPGEGSVLREGRAKEGRLELEYVLPNGQVVRYKLIGRNLTEAEVLDRGEVVERLSLVVSEQDTLSLYPKTATYRNLLEFRELKLELESVDYVDPFPPDIWLPELR